MNLSTRKWVPLSAASIQAIALVSAANGGGTVSYWLIFLVGAVLFGASFGLKAQFSRWPALVTAILWGGYLILEWRPFAKETWQAVDYLLTVVIVGCAIMDFRKVPAPAPPTTLPSMAVARTEQRPSAAANVADAMKSLSGAKRPSRDVPRLYHITRIENLESIEQYGLLSRKQLTAQSIHFVASDNQRRDMNLFRDGYVCVSVGFPQYQYLFSIGSNGSKGKYVILELNPLLLKDLDYFAFPTNAASEDIRIHWESGIREPFRGTAAFRELFADQYRILTSENQKRLRNRDAKLDPDCPNDPQSEILILDKIQSRLITNVYFIDQETMNAFKSSNFKLRPALSNVLEVRPELFDNRVDYLDWFKTRIDVSDFVQRSREL